MDASVREKVESSGVPIGDFLHSFSVSKSSLEDDEAGTQIQSWSSRSKKSSGSRSAEPGSSGSTIMSKMMMTLMHWRSRQPKKRLKKTLPSLPRGNDQLSAFI